jgi:hypothetical protein
MGDGEPLPDTGVSRVIANCTSVSSSDHHPREYAKRQRPCPEVQALSDQMDRYRRAESIRVMERLLCFLRAPAKPARCRVKVSYVEDVANHNGPESCGAAREGDDEALTGERIGRVLSHEINALPRERRALRDADDVEVDGRQHRMHRNRKAHLGSARSETPGMYGNTLCGNREIPSPPAEQRAAGRIGKSRDVKPMMNGGGKSDSSKVPAKLPNKAEEPAAEAIERRGLAKGNSPERNALRTQGRTVRSTRSNEYVKQSCVPLPRQPGSGQQDEKPSCPDRCRSCRVPWTASSRISYTP